MTMRARVTGAVVAVAGISVVIYSFFGIDEPTSPDIDLLIDIPCNDAFEAAAVRVRTQAQSPATAGPERTEDAFVALYPALAVCRHLAFWRTASSLHPDALRGVDPEDFARSACKTAPPDITTSPVCRSLAEE